MILDILRELFPWLSPIIAAFAGWAFGRRKQNAEATGGELENVEKGLEIYRKMKEDFVQWQVELRKELEAIKQENETLKKKLEDFVKKEKELKSENASLKRRVGQLESEIKEIRNERSE